MTSARPNRIRASEAAERLGVNIRTVQQMALRGEIPGAAKIGGIWTFDPAKLQSWVEGLEEENRRRAAAAAAPVPKYVPSRGDISVMPDEAIEARYQQLMRPKIKGRGRRKKPR